MSSAAAKAEPEDGTLIRQFGPTDTVADVLLAAGVVGRLGYVPEVRFADSAIELFVTDVPSLIGKLRASLDQGKENGRPRGA